MPVYTNEFINLTIEGLILLVTFFVNLTIALVVFFKNPKRRVNVVFAGIMSLIAFWNLSNFLCNATISYEIALLWTRLSLLPVLFIPSLLLYFSYIFPKREVLNKWYLFLVFIPGFLMLPFINTDYNTSHIALESWGVVFTPGILYIYFSIYFILYSGLTLFRLLSEYKRNKSKIVRAQLSYIFAGLFLSCAVGIITNSILPLLGSSRYDIYGTPFSIVFGLSTAYAITRYRFMDIKVILRKSFIYGLGVLFLLGLVVGGGIAIEKVLEIYFKLSPTVAVMPGVAFIVLAFPYLRNRIKNKLDEKFQKDYIDLSKKFAEFDNYSRAIDYRIHSFCRELSEEIKKTLRLSKIDFFVFNGQLNKFERYFPEDGAVKIKKDDSLIKLMEKVSGVILKEELSYFNESHFEFRNNFSDLAEQEAEMLLKLMNKKDLDFIIPFRLKRELIGFLSGTRAEKGAGFSSKDISYFEYAQERTNYILGSMRLNVKFLR